MPFLRSELEALRQFSTVSPDLYLAVVDMDSGWDREEPLEQEQAIVVFDAVRASNLIYAVQDAARFFELNRGRTAEDRGRMEIDVPLDPVLFRINRNHLNEGLKKTLLDGAGDWWLITISPDAGLEANAYFDPAAPEATPVKIAAIDPVPGEFRQILLDLSTTAHVPDSTSEELELILNGGGASRPSGVAVYDIGQGSSSAILDANGQPSYYFDFGWPLPFNYENPRLPRPNYCFSGVNVVILSHWDQDHWGGVRLPGRMWHPAENAHWIAPRQFMGTTHLALMSRLLSLGNFSMWPSTLSQLNFSMGQIQLCTGPNTMLSSQRNDSGLAVYVFDSSSSTHEALLMPGDADFPFVPTTSRGLAGLVASHHGARIKGIPTPATSDKLVFSVSSSNTYGHPSSGVEAAYRSAGWRNQRMTKNRANCAGTLATSNVGHTLLKLDPTAGLPVLPFCPACKASPCDTCLIQ
jgi:hypothetical protein